MNAHLLIERLRKAYNDELKKERKTDPHGHKTRGLHAAMVGLAEAESFTATLIKRDGWIPPDIEVEPPASKKGSFSRAEVRDPTFFRANRDEILQAAREGRIE